MPEDTTEVIDPGYPVSDGDELRLGPVVFGIRLDVPEGPPRKSPAAPGGHEPVQPGDGRWQGPDSL
jgi:hypothetical protein